MNIFYTNSSAFPHLSVVKKFALSIGNLPVRDLPKNSVVRITDRPNMTLAVDCVYLRIEIQILAFTG